METKIHLHLDLNSNIIVGALIALIGALNGQPWICGIGALQMFGRAGLSTFKEVAGKYADKNKIG